MTKMFATENWKWNRVHWLSMAISIDCAQYAQDRPSVFDHLQTCKFRAVICNFMPGHQLACNNSRPFNCKSENNVIELVNLTQSIAFSLSLYIKRINNYNELVPFFSRFASLQSLLAQLDNSLDVNSNTIDNKIKHFTSLFHLFHWLFSMDGFNATNCVSWTDSFHFHFQWPNRVNTKSISAKYGQFIQINSFHGHHTLSVWP